MDKIALTHTMTLDRSMLKTFMNWNDERKTFTPEPKILTETFNLSRLEQKAASEGIWPKNHILIEGENNPVGRKAIKARSGYEGDLNLDRYQSYSQEPYDTRKKRKVYKPCRIAIQANLPWSEKNERLSGICRALAEGINRLTQSGYTVSIDAIYYLKDVFEKLPGYVLLTTRLKTEETDYTALEILAHKSFPRLSAFCSLMTCFKETGRTDYDESYGSSINRLPDSVLESYDIAIQALHSEPYVKQAISSLIAKN